MPPHHLEATGSASQKNLEVLGMVSAYDLKELIQGCDFSV